MTQPDHICKSTPCLMGGTHSELKLPAFDVQPAELEVGDVVTPQYATIDRRTAPFDTALVVRVDDTLVHLARPYSIAPYYADEIYGDALNIQVGIEQYPIEKSAKRLTYTLWSRVRSRYQPEPQPTPPARPSPTVAAFELLDLGVEHAQYFRGVGTAYTNWDEVYTGTGDTAHQAASDAIEQMHCSTDATEPDEISRAIDEQVALFDDTVSAHATCHDECTHDEEDDCQAHDECELHHYAAIWIRYEAPPLPFPNHLAPPSRTERDNG